MLKDLTANGMVLGIVAGLLVTLFDGFFILSPNIYFPYSYAILLVVFNTLFWMTVGGLSGFALWAFVRKRDDIQAKENFYWAFFFLLPFALIYGFLGRLSLVKGALPVADHHLSFVWVFLIFVFLFLCFKKSVKERGIVHVFFIPEIVTAIVLFQFCSNPSVIQAVSYPYLTEFLTTLHVAHTQHFKIVYMLGVFLIMAVYLITFYATRPLKKKTYHKQNYLAVGILFILVVICLTSFLLWNHLHYAIKMPVAIDSKQIFTQRKDTNVILIVLDTVRADSLSMCNNAGATKNLEEFSRDALVFENCVAPSSWTVPSHASLFTGLYPTEHGSHGMLDSEERDRFGFPLAAPLAEEFDTLAEILRENGYKTGGIVSNFTLHPELRFDQGFHHYSAPRGLGIVYIFNPFRPLIHLFCDLTNICLKYIVYYRRSDEINEEILRFLDTFARSPFFLFVNYNDAHGPHRPPRPFNGYFLDTAFPQLYRLKQYFLNVTGKLNKESWEAYQLTQYYGAIAFLDYQLGKFFSRLKHMGIYDSSLIIITSDHGELWGEHGLYRHRKVMYEPLLRIPLMIKYPYSRRTGREKRMISLVYLYPTIFSICGIPVPENSTGKAFGNAAGPHVAEFYGNSIGEHRVLYDGKYKYMRYEYEKDPELYDLDEDPMEQENLAEKLTKVTSAMEEKLKDWEKTHRARHTTSNKDVETLYEDELRELKALGYIQ